MPKRFRWGLRSPVPSGVARELLLVQRRDTWQSQLPEEGFGIAETVEAGNTRKGQLAGVRQQAATLDVSIRVVGNESPLAVLSDVVLGKAAVPRRVLVAGPAHDDAVRTKVLRVVAAHGIRGLRGHQDTAADHRPHREPGPWDARLRR